MMNEQNGQVSEPDSPIAAETSPAEAAASLPEQKEEPVFERKSFYKMVLRIGLPIALQGLLTSLVDASDTLMLAALSQDSLSAISLATQVHFVLNMIFISINVVISSMSAQYWARETM